MCNYVVRALMIVPLLLQACMPLPMRDPAFAPVNPDDLRPEAHNDGAIFQANYDMRLFEALTARHVGDVLTVVLQENNQAQKNADLTANKNTSIAVSAPTLFGVSPGKLFGHSIESEVSDKNKFTGEGGANQSNSLTGEISVTVVRVLPNGNLLVRGEKRLTLNQGDEFIRLSGIVRPVDIDVSNTVSSSLVADATLMFIGNGAPADSSKMGWLERFFNSPWFPF